MFNFRVKKIKLKIIYIYCIYIQYNYSAESFTADHKPLMGEAPEVRGFYLGCGFNSSGIMLAGGCGRELAKWITHGHPTLDMYGYDIRYSV